MHDRDALTFRKIDDARPRRTFARGAACAAARRARGVALEQRDVLDRARRDRRDVDGVRIGLALIACAGCAGVNTVHIDRFSDVAGHLMKRSANAGLPGPDQPIDLSRAPFSTQGLAPDGSVVRYYNFDAQRDRPATLWRLIQHDRAIGDVVDALPGDATYNDFWRVVLV